MIDRGPLSPTSAESRIAERLAGFWAAWRHAGRQMPRLAWPAWRDYAPGDDYRQVDWPFCARNDELLSRRSAAPGNENLVVLLDASSAMDAGTPSKWLSARRLVQSIFVAEAGCRLVTLVAFARGVVDRFESRGHKLVGADAGHWLVRRRPQPGSADLPAAAAALARQRRQPGSIFVVSGSYDLDGVARGLTILRDSGYRPTLIHLFDREEAFPTRLGDVVLRDPQTGLLCETTLTERDLSRYRGVYRRFCEELRHGSGARQVACLAMCTDFEAADWIEQATTGEAAPR